MNPQAAGIYLTLGIFMVYGNRRDVAKCLIRPKGLGGVQQALFNSSSMLFLSGSVDQMPLICI